MPAAPPQVLPPCDGVDPDFYSVPQAQARLGGVPGGFPILLNSIQPIWLRNRRDAQPLFFLAPRIAIFASRAPITKFVTASAGITIGRRKLFIPSFETEEISGGIPSPSYLASASGDPAHEIQPMMAGLHGLSFPNLLKMATPPTALLSSIAPPASRFDPKGRDGTVLSAPLSQPPPPMPASSLHDRICCWDSRPGGGEKGRQGRFCG
jgi:hypothetical protein